MSNWPPVDILLGTWQSGVGGWANPGARHRLWRSSHARPSSRTRPATETRGQPHADGRRGGEWLLHRPPGCLVREGQDPQPRKARHAKNRPQVPSPERLSGHPTSGVAAPAARGCHRQIVQSVIDDLAVVHDVHGRNVDDRAFGWVDRGRTISTRQDVRMPLASVAKPTTAVANHQTAREHALDLDSLVLDFGQPGGVLLDLAPFPPFGNIRLSEVTVRQLFRHSGGRDRGIVGDLNNREIEIAAAMSEPSLHGRANTVRYILDQPLELDPGSDRSYSNIGCLLLGVAIDKVSRRNYLSYVIGSVFDPRRPRVPPPSRSSDRDAKQSQHSCRRPSQITSAAFPVPTDWNDGGTTLGDCAAPIRSLTSTGTISTTSSSCAIAPSPQPPTRCKSGK